MICMYIYITLSEPTREIPDKHTHGLFDDVFVALLAVRELEALKSIHVHIYLCRDCIHICLYAHRQCDHVLVALLEVEELRALRRSIYIYISISIYVYADLYISIPTYISIYTHIGSLTMYS